MPFSGLRPEENPETEPEADPLISSPEDDRGEPTPDAKAPQPSVILGTAGQPDSRPSGGALANDPQIQQLLEEEPRILPHVELVSHFQRAQAEAEVAFREAELKGRWAEWCGVYPW